MHYYKTIKTFALYMSIQMDLRFSLVDTWIPLFTLFWKFVIRFLLIKKMSIAYQIFWLDKQYKFDIEEWNDTNT